MAGQQYWMYGASDFMGQRFYSPTIDAFNPTAVGPIMAVTPNVIPSVVPPGSPAGLASPSSMSNYNADVDQAGANPWSFTKSPVIVAVIFIVIALLGLRYIHFRG